MSFGALGLLPTLVCSSSLGWCRWSLSCGVCLLASFGALGLLLSLPPAGCCCHLSNDPLRLLLMVCVAFCASGYVRLVSCTLVVLLACLALWGSCPAWRVSVCCFGALGCLSSSLGWLRWCLSFVSLGASAPLLCFSSLLVPHHDATGMMIRVEGIILK